MKTGTIIALILLICVPVHASDKPIRFVLSGAIIGVGVADTALTIWGTQHGAVEKNSLWAPLLEKRQYAALWTFEALGTGVIVLACNFLIHNKPTRIAGVVLAGTVIILRGYLCIRNARINRGL